MDQQLYGPVNRSPLSGCRAHRLAPAKRGADRSEAEDHHRPGGGLRRALGDRQPPRQIGAVRVGIAAGWRIIGFVPQRVGGVAIMLGGKAVEPSETGGAGGRGAVGLS